jgi:hypothetical protein
MAALAGPAVNPKMIAYALADRLQPTLREQAALASTEPGHPLVSLTGLPLSAALLFHKLAETEPDLAPAAHEALNLAARSCTDTTPCTHLYDGVMAVAFVARVLSRGGDRYERSIAAMDSRIEAALGYQLDLAEADPRWPRAFDEYDLIRGLAGAVRYLLIAPERNHRSLRRCLDLLARLTAFKEVAGKRVLGCWVSHTPDGRLRAPGRLMNGHVNLGVAHGLAGAMAVMALAEIVGVGTPVARRALIDMRTWYMDFVEVIDGFPVWPGALSFDQVTLRTIKPAPSGAQQVSWCYGSSGICNALDLADKALGDGRCDVLVLGVVEGFGSARRLATAEGDSLCHGHAGILRCVQRLSLRSTGAPPTRLAIDTLADGLSRRAAERLRQRTPTGETRSGSGASTGGLGDPGLLEGMVGVALALLDVGGFEPPGLCWDVAMALS